MKELAEIIQQAPVFLGFFENAQDVFHEFFDADREGGALEGLVKTHPDRHILFAVYGAGGYEGSAFVLFERDGELYEVNASHCSCYGLEDQWDPEETTVDALAYRLNEGKLGDANGEDFSGALAEFLGVALKPQLRDDE